MKANSLRRSMLAAAAALFFIPGCEPAPVEGRKVGNLCPEIAGMDEKGANHKLSDFRGKVVYVNFWAPWCGPCRQLIPHERELVESKYKDRPFAILGVAFDSRDAVEDFTRTTPLPWPNLIDGRSGIIARTWDVEGIPAGILIDHKGVIRGVWLDGVNPKVVDRAIESAVNEAEKK